MTKEQLDKIKHRWGYAPQWLGDPFLMLNVDTRQVWELITTVGAQEVRIKELEAQIKYLEETKRFDSDS